MRLWSFWMMAGALSALPACSEPVANAPATTGAAGDAASGNDLGAGGNDGARTTDTVAAPDSEVAAPNDAVAPGDTTADTTTDTPDTAPDLTADTAPDLTADTAVDIEPADTQPDWADLLDPPDIPADTPDVAPDTKPPLNPDLSVVYAHTSDALFKLEPAGFQSVGKFTFDKSAGQMTDIALDENGNLYGVTFGDLFTCSKSDAKCKWLASLPQSFNGLTFVPKGTVKPNQESLIAIANSGDWLLVDVQAGKANLTKLGTYGGGMTSSGDAFSVEGVGTYATVKQGPFGGDKLAVVDPKTGTVTKVVGDTGVTDLWGVAWTGGVLYGFAANGQVYELDMATGKAKPTAAFKVPPGVSWWGAGVSTRAALGD
jgi:hypothetical protein